jgi:hypothetical protein
LEWYRLLAVHFCLLAFEDGPEGQEFSKYASYGPHIDCRRIVSGSEKEFRGPVPNRDNDFVAGEEGVKRFVEKSGQAQISDSYFSA